MENNPKLKFARINNQHNNDNHESSSSSAINFISVPTSSPSSATVSLSSSLSVSQDIAPAPAPSRSGELVTDADGPFSRDKHDMIVRIFNFYKETVHRFPSAHQEQHDEDLLNRLILQCIGTTSRPATWNRPSTYVSPYTPIKPSKMHINDLPQDCIEHLMNQFKSLQDLVEKAFVCAAWVPAVAKIVSGRIHSLKVFESEENIELYQEHALMQYNLARLDLAAGVQTGDRKEDHIFVQPFRDYDKNLGIFDALFTKVTYLVLHTLNIDHAGLIRCIDKLTSVTLFKLPNSDKQQNSIWEALNAAPVLRHVHIFYANGEFPFEADKMDFLTRIESFTLDNYTQGNLFDILKRLGPQLRCLQIGPFAQGDQVLKWLIEQNPDMVAKLTQLSVRLDEKCMETAPYNEPYEESYLVHKKMLQLIVDHFTELNYLDMEFASLIFSTEVIHNLGKLPKLTELRFANRKIYSGFLSFTDQQLLGVANHHDHLLPTPLTNIRKVYLVKNNSYDDCHFLARLFEDDQNNDQDAGMLEDFAADPINVFQGIEQVTFVINGANWRTGSFFCLRNSILETIPPQYWLRLRLYNVEVGKMNEGFVARNEQDVAQIVRRRKVLNNARRALVDVKDGWMLDDVREQNDGFDDDDDDHFGDENDNDRDARIAAQANQALEANQFWQAAQNALRQNIPGHANERIDENPLQENLQQRLDDMREGFIRERVQFELNIVARNAQPRRRNRRQQQHPYILLRNR